MPCIKNIIKLSIYVFVLAFLFNNSLFAQKRARHHKKEKEHSITSEHAITGTATWYSNNFNGKKTASGEIFSQKKLTCATNKFKIGTWLRVENIATRKFVVVRVNDRMAAHPRKIIDLTRAAAVEIGIVGKGFARVKIESLGTSKPKKID